MDEQKRMTFHRLTIREAIELRLVRTKFVTITVELGLMATRMITVPAAYNKGFGWSIRHILLA